jgi:hypothetical protein
MKAGFIGIFVITLLSLMLVISCDLRRSNPLDPESHSDIYAPPRVTGLTATGSGPGVANKFVELRWTKNQTHTDGYYIYRGLAYNAEYARVDSIGNVSPDAIVTKIVTIISPGFYYFKVSAYKDYPSGRLEGSLSEWAIARVDN